MDPVGALIGFAEVSLGLAGFAAIVLVLATRSASLDPILAANVRILIANGVGSAFSGLIGITILALGASPPFAWSLASGLVLLGVIGGSAANFLLFLRHLEAQDRLVVLWWSIAVVAAVLHLVNAVGLFGSGSFGLFFAGLVVLLAQAGAMFVRMVYALLGRSAA